MQSSSRQLQLNEHCLQRVHEASERALALAGDGWGGTDDGSEPDVGGETTDWETDWVTDATGGATDGEGLTDAEGPTDVDGAPREGGGAASERDARSELLLYTSRSQRKQAHTPPLPPPARWRLVLPRRRPLRQSSHSCEGPPQLISD